MSAVTAEFLERLNAEPRQKASKSYALMLVVAALFVTLFSVAPLAIKFVQSIVCEKHILFFADGAE